MIVKNGVVYICKSDIDKNWTYLLRRGFGNFSRNYLKNEFEEYLDYYGEDTVTITGSKIDKKRQRHTKFVELNKFYRFCVKGSVDF